MNLRCSYRLMAEGSTEQIKIKFEALKVLIGGISETHRRWPGNSRDAAVPYHSRVIRVIEAEPAVLVARSTVGNLRRGLVFKLDHLLLRAGHVGWKVTKILLVTLFCTVIIAPAFCWLLPSVGSTDKCERPAKFCTRLVTWPLTAEAILCSAVWLAVVFAAAEASCVLPKAIRLMMSAGGSDGSEE